MKSNFFWFVYVCFGVSNLYRNTRNKTFISDSAETIFGSGFASFESDLVSKDTHSTHTNIVVVTAAFNRLSKPFMNSMLYIAQLLHTSKHLRPAEFIATHN